MTVVDFILCDGYIERGEVLKIKNLDEKQLLAARYFIIKKEKGNEFQDKDLFDLWMKYFPADFWLNRKKYRMQKFIYQEESENGCLSVPDRKGVPKYVIDRYNILWNSCCVAINDFISRYSLNECDKELTELRKKHRNIIKRRCYGICGNGDICNWPTNKLCTYTVCVDGESYIGNYEKCLKYIEQKKYDRRK